MVVEKEYDRNFILFLSDCVTAHVHVRVYGHIFRCPRRQARELGPLQLEFQVVRAVSGLGTKLRSTGWSSKGSQRPIHL